VSDPSSETDVPSWTLGWRLRRSLDKEGLTAQQMADVLEVSPSQVSRWLRDKGASPRRVYLREWAERCRVPYDWLVGGSPKGPESDETAESRRSTHSYREKAYAA
jgi:transcriptional regulator with XRE-family HTH domain